MKVAKVSALRTDRLYHYTYESTPVNPSRIEPATLRLVAQCLNQLRHRVTPNHVNLINCAPDSNQKHVSSRYKEPPRAFKYEHNYSFTQLKEYTAKNISTHVLYILNCSKWHEFCWRRPSQELILSILQVAG